jgi:hypothetical protein
MYKFFIIKVINVKEVYVNNGKDRGRKNDNWYREGHK